MVVVSLLPKSLMILRLVNSNLEFYIGKEILEKQSQCNQADKWTSSTPELVAYNFWTIDKHLIKKGLPS